MGKVPRAARGAAPEDARTPRVALSAIVSFRLGMADGVSIVAATWQRALEELGFDVVTVAGEGPVDRLVPSLAIGATNPPSLDELREALRDVDLVVVENLLSIPMNLPASLAVAQVLAGRAAVLHHHDPPWQRKRYEHITTLPPDDAAWRHVTINELTRKEMRSRHIEAVTIYNTFDIDAVPGDRCGTRAHRRGGGRASRCTSRKGDRPQEHSAGDRPG